MPHLQRSKLPTTHDKPRPPPSLNGDGRACVESGDEWARSSAFAQNDAFVTRPLSALLKLARSRSQARSSAEKGDAAVPFPNRRSSGTAANLISQALPNRDLLPGKPV